MKSQQHHTYSTKLFSFIVLLLCSFYSGYSQTTVEYITSGTWTCPAGVTSATVEVWGAGGGGGGSINTNSNAGGGGGGGAYVKKTITVAAGSYTITIGAAGTGGASGVNGTKGGNSIFGSNLIIANGGNGGSLGSSGAGGTGGIASGGDVNYNGGNGAAGVNNTSSGGGGGGAGTTGAGGNATGITAGSGTTLFGGNGGAGVQGNGIGLPGEIYSGGGSGGYGKGKAGGGGASGYMRITYTVVTNNCPTSTSIAPASTQNLCQGTAASLLTATITTSGGSGIPTRLYQWYYNTTNSNTVAGATKIAGATAQTYTPLTTASEVGTRYYFCVGYATDNSCAQTDATQSLASSIIVQVTVSAPPTPPANAGSTQNISVSTATLNGNTPTVGTGTWTKISGSGTITTPTNPGTTVTGLTNGPSVFRWTISNGACTASWSEVTINVTLPVCNLTASGLANITCNNNGTSTNPADDTFSFTLNPTGTILGATYNVSGSITQTGISYGSATTFSGNLISAGNLTITITDVSTNCSFGPFTVTAPATCSLACNLTSSGLNSIVCNNIGTLGSETDDTFSFKLKPTGTYLGSTYSISGSFTQSGISYASTTTFSGFLISAGNLNITITDDTTGTCQLAVTVIAPAPCSLNHAPIGCNSCHILHNSPGSNLTNKGGNALLCQNCHFSTGTASAKPLVDGKKANPELGTGNSHSWAVAGVRGDNRYQTNLPTNNEMLIRMPEDPPISGPKQLICSTCHNQHNNGNAGSPYLRISNTGDAMCKDCHNVRDVQRFQDGASNKGSHPVGVTYGAISKLNVSPANTQVVGGKVECSSCHGVHDVTDSGVLTTDGNLLRMPNNVDLCKDCHNYVGHSGFDCLDCHEVHNTVDGFTGNNIMMIRDNIDTPGGNRPVVFTAKTDFVNTANAVRDGICVVCHSGSGLLTHDIYNNDALVLHDDGSNRAGQTCTSCHLHNDATNAFTQPIGVQSCTSCHASAQSGGRGAVVQIVGSGGEFNITRTSTHVGGATPVEPDATTCEACHYESAGDHPSLQMLLEDPENLNTVFSGDTDVYCVGCHDGAPPAGLWTDISAGAEYNKSAFIGGPHDFATNSCAQCHERHGSDFANLLKAGDNYSVCRACHDGGISTINIDVATIANPIITGTGNNHAWDVNATNATLQALPPLTSPMVDRMEGSNIVCSTCHQPHAGTAKLLVSTNTADEMCKDCHRARDVQRFQDAAPNKGSHPVGVTYSGTGSVKATPTGSVIAIGGNVECSSCHQPHNAATNDGNLLRQTNNVTLCTDCHTYGNHDGMTCLDCHEVHNSVDGTIGNNILMIRDNIVTPTNGTLPVVFTSRTGANSFADNSAPYTDGICEVCHDNTNTTNTDDGVRNHPYNAAPDPDAGNHYAGSDCTSCHPHSANFAPQGCHNCHERTTPGEAQSYPLTGAHEKHAGLQYEFTCSTCHFELGAGSPGDALHINNTKNVAFEPGGLAYPFGANAGLTPTWDPGTKTCSNVYCHSNGRNAHRGEDTYNSVLYDWATLKGSQPGTFVTTPAWDSGPNTTCTMCHAGKGNMSAPYMISRNSPTTQVIQSSADMPSWDNHNHSMLNSNNYGNAGWPAAQCFWCHSVDGSPNQGVGGTALASDLLYQGTYGTSKHVDGQTFFAPFSTTGNGTTGNIGTWASWNTRTNDGSKAHCAGPGGGNKNTW